MISLYWSDDCLHLYKEGSVLSSHLAGKLNFCLNLKKLLLLLFILFLKTFYVQMNGELSGEDIDALICTFIWIHCEILQNLQFCNLHYRPIFIKFSLNILFAFCYSFYWIQLQTWLELSFKLIYFPNSFILI